MGLHSNLHRSTIAESLLAIAAALLAESSLSEPQNFVTGHSAPKFDRTRRGETTRLFRSFVTAVSIAHHVDSRINTAKPGRARHAQTLSSTRADEPRITDKRSRVTVSLQRITIPSRRVPLLRCVALVNS
jgi:hypothetical protein